MANSITYTTVQGDTFDMLSYRAYGDEFKAHYIIQANPNYANVLVFSQGIELTIPIISKEAASTLPPWKR
ncbi:tail protein X [Clostridium chromiireducens]|uniref:tail protein X n=1 Tax=Clostridium chromiireducens TaxID=225345 RepID=UPI001FA979F1|nr:tail protein X [Clostridium chromiireducens]